MRILLSWLEDFVEIRESPDELAEALTMAGMAVDAVEREGEESVFEFDITSNRPDAMNHYGIAREISALYRRPLRAPVIEFDEDKRQAAEFASIEIADPDLCARYVGRVLLGVETAPSPDWLRKRLELCGVRSINNIADLTNYVLLEIGHPTHAFDLDLLGERAIIVRRARKGETLTTLDGVDRELSPERLVIADAHRPIALAGVMGGLESEISDSTRNVLIEAAWFDPGSIRRTARHFGMHTEASHRFERGADWDAPPWAADRIAGLLNKLSPGVVLKGRLDVYPSPRTRPAIVLRRERLRDVVGLSIPDAAVEEILGRLGFEPRRTEEGWTTPAPSHRLDVSREIDLIEEVIRVHGYGRLPASLPPIGSAPEPAPHAEEEARLRETVRALGYDETVGYAFISAEEAERFGSWPAVPLRNPLTELWAVMRNSSVPTMLHALERNLNRNEPDIRLAEMGRLYRGGDGAYEEPAVLTLGASGAARPPGLLEPAKAFDFFDLKADVEAVLAPFDLNEVRFSDREVPACYLPGRSARVTSYRGLLGVLGELDPKSAPRLKLKQPVFLAEIFLDPLYEAGLRQPRYRPIPRVPAVHRDFSLLVPEGIPFAEIRTAIGRMERLVELRPLEIFRGKQVPEGFYGLLLRAVWQRTAESLTDEEVNGYARAVSANLEKKLGVKQRT